MKKLIYKLSIVIVPIVLCFSMVLVLNVHGDSEKYTQNLFETENDYRLKFVDSTDYELSLGSTDKIILPVEIISATEENGEIVITTYENAVILAPVACSVNSVIPVSSEIELKSGNIVVVISNIITGVKTGDSLLCGDVIGTVKGNTCNLKVFWGSRKLTLAEIKAII